MCIDFRNKEVEVIGVWGKRNLNGTAGAADRLLKVGLENCVVDKNFMCEEKRMRSS